MCDNYYFYEKQTHPLKKKRDFNTMTTDFGQNRKRNERFSKPKAMGPLSLLPLVLIGALFVSVDAENEAMLWHVRMKLLDDAIKMELAEGW